MSAEQPDVTDLPYVDEHAVRIPAGRDRVWPALLEVASSLGASDGGLAARLLGTVPGRGFEVSSSEPGERLSLTGRHRFSRYVLRFELSDAAAGSTQLRARTYAAFPGVTGRVYRALVISTRLHVVATNHVLHRVRRRSTGTP